MGSFIAVNRLRDAAPRTLPLSFLGLEFTSTRLLVALVTASRLVRRPLFDVIRLREVLVGVSKLVLHIFEQVHNFPFQLVLLAVCGIREVTSHELAGEVEEHLLRREGAADQKSGLFVRVP